MRKPLSGAIWGLILGIAIAVILQQQGIWPLDKITVFLLPGAVGLIGVIITSVGRGGGAVALTIAVVVTGAATAYGATGIGEINEQGQLNGGCTVEATSAVDSTTVDDTSKRDPFVIDPTKGLSWKAHSPSVFDDYPWRMYVEVGGGQITLDQEASENNDEGDQDNEDSIPNVQAYGESRGVPMSQLRGVFKVGGFASVCNGFGFVKFLAEPLETIIAKVAAALALLALIMLLRAALMGRGGEAAVAGGPNGSRGDGGSGDADVDGDVEPGDVSAFGAAAGAAGTSDGDIDGDGEVEGEDFTSLSDDLA